jgi:hypothetical protein
MAERDAFRWRLPRRDIAIHDVPAAIAYRLAMAILPCPACQKPMNDAAIVCPHCNARRAGIAPGLAGKALSPAEIRALVLTNEVLAPAPAPGLFSALVLPHASTTGVARIVEVALTVVSLPLVAAGALTFALSRSRTRRKYEATRGELAPVLAMMSLGSLALSTILSLLGASFTANLAVTAVSIVALIGRAMIRSRASTARNRALSDDAH